MALCVPFVVQTHESTEIRDAKRAMLISVMAVILDNITNNNYNTELIECLKIVVENCSWYDEHYCSGTTRKIYTEYSNYVKLFSISGENKYLLALEAVESISNYWGYYLEDRNGELSISL